MDVVYKKWNPDEGLEEVQAKIYTGVSGLPARPEEIKPRNIRRGEDSTHYVLSKEGEPLAYVTSWINDENPTEGGIGYPWSFPECPLEAKEKIFSELFTHLKKEKKLKDIRTGIVLSSKIAKDQIKFFEEKGFKEHERAYRFTKDLDVDKMATKKLEGKAAELKSRPATNDDVDILIEVALSDPQLNRAFPDEDGFRNYFENRVLKDGNAVLILDGDKVVAASAALKLKPDGVFLFGDEERVLMRFTAIRPGYDYAWKKLVVEIAKPVKNAGWKDIPIRVGFGFNVEGAVARGVAGLIPDLEEYELFMTYKVE
ncbi:MAG: GNAT family protein [Candidatus Thorarchaeota archaeon SMTZ1-45]|nr:MAG: hypothetical protein AM325_16980 [Candidatus Thorarchaeota archaeon SMTZ1-45]